MSPRGLAALCSVLLGLYALVEGLFVGSLFLVVCIFGWFVIYSTVLRDLASVGTLAMWAKLISCG